MLKRIRNLAIASLLISAQALFAQEKHADHVPGMSHKPILTQPMPIEGGQSAFAALIEIIALLESDQNTQWASVDIDALREHLLDMDKIMLSTSANTQKMTDNTVQFDVRGTGAALDAIHTMVAAHTRFIRQSREWDVKSDLTSTGALIQIMSNDTATIEQLTALGFYGFMSLDSHHQAHHFGIATGTGH